MANRKKPCEFCEEDIIETLDGKNGHQLFIEFYPNNNLLGITSFVFDEIGETQELQTEITCNYCPNCGRKIGC